MNSGVVIVVAGMIAGDPYQGGATWAVLQYVLGLRELGHDVYFIEPVAADKLRPGGTSLSRSTSAAYFRSVMGQFELESRAALLLAGTKETVGLPYDFLRTVAARSDCLINISGMLADPALTEPIPVRVYLDLDPGFNQLWSAAEGIDVGFDGHTHFVTIGPALGDADCVIPTCGRSWIATRQPVVLSEWPPAARVTHDAFTTVAHWRGYGSITHNGVFYGQKAHAWRQFMALPDQTREQFLVALAIHPDETRDILNLAAHHWRLIEPARVSDTPDRYRRFVQGSKGEIGVAKSGYATARCGWFSDRSVCYLASGRPVVAQETGFSRFLPTGEGLFAFETTDEASTAIDAVAHDYARHSRSARAIAEEYFDASRVLPQLLERVRSRAGMAQHRIRLVVWAQAASAGRRPMNCAPRWTSCWPAAREPRRIVDVDTRPLPYARASPSKSSTRFDDGSRIDLV